LVKNKGYSIGNIDSTICLQQPKINPYIPEMKKVLAEVMEIDVDDLSIKATTTERLGFVGKEEGVSAHAVVLIQK
jgi:2-C-methyl-D-erythritol 2,4-cyclodiphosphate synthase